MTVEEFEKLKKLQEPCYACKDAVKALDDLMAALSRYPTACPNPQAPTHIDCEVCNGRGVLLTDYGKAASEALTAHLEARIERLEKIIIETVNEPIRAKHGLGDEIPF